LPYSRINPLGKQATRLIGARVIFPIVTLVAGIILFAIGAIAFSARQSDEAANRRDLSAVISALDVLVRRMPQEQQSVFVGNEAYEKIVLEFNHKWTHDNIGRQLNEVHGHDIVAVVSATGRPLYMMLSGKKQPATEFSAIFDSISGLVAEVQNRRRRDIVEAATDKTETQDRLNRFRRNNLVKKVHAVDIAKIDGHVAIVSAMAVTPAVGPQVADLRSIPMVISVKFLSETVLKEVGKTAVVEDISFEPLDIARKHTINLAHMLLRDHDNKPLGMLHWKSSLPGTKLVEKAAPVAALAFLMLIAFTIFIINTAHRAAREVEASEAKARHDALFDALTGLPNRHGFTRHVTAMLEAAEASRARVGCARMDINGFTEINDTYGHDVGDKVLVEVASRITGALGTDRLLARSGGDEFAVCCPNLATVTEMTAICNVIMSVLAEPVRISDYSLICNVSIGYAVAPEHGTTTEEILRRADVAMHTAKKNAPGTIVPFTMAIEDRTRERQSLIHDLRQALASSGLKVLYQPIIDSADLSTIGVEALIRWDHPERGPISPAVFIPIAEEFGMIDEIGRWVLTTACHDGQQWPDISVAVNISPVHLRQPDFARQVAAITELTGFDPTRLTIEVTESIVLEHEAEARRIFEQMHDAGVKIALDDFGTGYSSLSYLEQFRFDKLKIDRAFLKNLETSPQAAAIVHTIVGLGDTLSMTIVAEGVENEAQCRFLQAIGCHELQGFLFSKPISADDIDRRLKVETMEDDDVVFLAGPLACQIIA